MPNTNEILIYVSALNNRIHFLFRHVFSNMMGIRPVLTNDKDAFLQCQTPKLNYSSERFNNELYIKPSGLLYEKGTRPINIEVKQTKGLTVLFPNYGDSDFYFDIFSAIFYLLTRYEEYLPYKPDKFGRFQPTGSIAYEQNFIDEPIVEQWVEELKIFLKQKFPDFEYQTLNKFKYIPTIDVDVAFAYRLRNVVFNFGLFTRDLFTFHFKEFYLRALSVTHLIKDPFDNYSFIEDAVKSHPVKPIFFFLSGNRAKFDRNLSLSKKVMRQVVKHTHEFAEVGLHPSYASSRKIKTLAWEKNNLEVALEQPVFKTRQHYIKIYFPKTYQNLVKLGLTEDYSMGYAQSNGFRAGTCTPFHFYDLTRDKELNILIVPFQAMDATFRTYLKQSPQEAEKKLTEYYHKIKKVNGTFSIIWHNDTFAPTQEGKQWRKVFENLLNLD